MLQTIERAAPPQQSTDLFMAGYRAARLDWKRHTLYAEALAGGATWREGYRKFLAEFADAIATRRARDLGRCGFLSSAEIADTSIYGRERVAERLARADQRLRRLAQTNPHHPAYSFPYHHMLMRLCRQERAAVAFQIEECIA